MFNWDDINKPMPGKTPVQSAAEIARKTKALSPLLREIAATLSAEMRSEDATPQNAHEFLNLIRLLEGADHMLAQCKTREDAVEILKTATQDVMQFGEGENPFINRLAALLEEQMRTAVIAVESGNAQWQQAKPEKQR